MLPKIRNPNIVMDMISFEWLLQLDGVLINKLEKTGGLEYFNT